ncbi:MAG: GGDEF domain-containing protein [Phycisphaerales bacterium]
MSSLPSQPGPPSADPPTLRLITVGRTGLEHALRRAASAEAMELVRVPTPLEAVGELGEPLDSIDRAAVLIADGSVAPEETLSFIAALRLIDPSAPVLLVADTDAAAADAPIPAGYDGIVPPDATAEEVLSAIALMPEPDAAHPPRVRHPPPVLPEGVAEVAQRPKTGEAPHSAPAPADTPLIHALLTGRDLLIPAMDLIRARVASPLVHFTPAPAAGTTAPAPSAPSASIPTVPVCHRAKVFGTLASPALAADALAPHGLWLGAWLALADQQTALRQAAMLDDLTGAYNRRYFDRYLAAALQQAQSHRHTLTLMVFDIDDFKYFNDRFGHPAGDDILRETVRLLRSVIRPGDRVCRIGGDEFAVIFYEPQGPRDPASKPPESVSLIAQRFQSQVREHRFPKLADKAPGPLTISGGLATFPWDGRTVDELLERADQLALESKRAGKNAITLGPGHARA